MGHDIPLAGRVAAAERFDTVMEQYGRLLSSAILRLCPREMAAEYDDIRQEACLRVWRAVASGREIASPASYVYRVAATTTIDAIRRVKARREEAGGRLDTDVSEEIEPRAAPHEGPDLAAEHQQLVERTSRALADLTVDRRRAVSLHLQGLTTTEIGGLLGWSEAKARNLVYRALKELRARLRAEGFDYGQR